MQISTISQGPPRSEELQKSQALRSAKEFEAMLLETILGPLEKSFSMDREEPSTAGSEAYQSLGTQALAKTLSEHGGLGFAERITQSLCKTKTLKSAQNY